MPSPNSTYGPGLVPSINNTTGTITVDSLVNPVREIAPTVYGLVKEDQGYIAEDILTMGPGLTGPAVIYTEDDPALRVLDPLRDLAPRAIGAQAPDIGTINGDRKFTTVESWAGTITVTDEQVRWNLVTEVQNDFTAAANSFSIKGQTRALAVANAFLLAKNRTVTANTKWNATFTSGTVNVDPITKPMASIQLAVKKFVTDKGGIRPDTIIMHSTDFYYLTLVYEDKLTAILATAGLTAKVSDLQPLGSPLVLKRGAVGWILPEKQLDTERERFGRAKKDEYTLETSLAYVPKNAGAGVIIQGTNA